MKSAQVLDYSTTPNRRGGFWLGFVVGVLLAVGANVIPYVRTRGAWDTDGVEKVGCPYIFRSFGGYRPTYFFSYRLLIADIAIALGIGVLSGIAMNLSLRTMRFRA
jgi:hypothetical protein